MSPKSTFKKSFRHGSAFRAIISWSAVFSGGSILILHIARLTKGGSLSAGDIRRVLISAFILLILVSLAAAQVFKASTMKIEFYREFLGSIPIPALLTDQSGTLQFANKAAEELLDYDNEYERGQYNTRHLINIDGSITDKIWSHDGAAYHVSGTSLMQSGACFGYIITLEQVQSQESAAEQEQVFSEALRLIDSLISITKFTSSYAGAIKDLADHVCDIPVDSTGNNADHKSNNG